MAKKPEQAQKPAENYRYKAFSMMRAAGGYVLIETFVQVNADGSAEVVDVKTSQPDLKAITTEKMKIAIAQEWGKL